MADCRKGGEKRKRTNLTVSAKCYTYYIVYLHIYSTVYNIYTVYTYYLYMYI